MKVNDNPKLFAIESIRLAVAETYMHLIIRFTPVVPTIKELRS